MMLGGALLRGWPQGQRERERDVRSVREDETYSNSPPWKAAQNGRRASLRGAGTIDLTSK